MRIDVQVTQMDAINRAELQHGILHVTIQSWDGWTDKERAALATSPSPVRLGAVHSPTPEGLLAWAQEAVARAAEKAAEKAKEMKKIKAAIARLPALMAARIDREGLEWLRNVNDPYIFVHGGSSACADDIAGTDLSSRVQSMPIPPDIRELVQAEINQEKEAAKVARATAEAKKEAAKIAQAQLISKLDKFCLTAEQRSRLNAGVLPSAERAQAHSDGMLNTISPHRDLYVRLEAEDIPHTDECFHEDTHYDVDELEELTAKRYAAVQEIRALCCLDNLPDGAAAWELTIDSWRHTGRCRQCIATVTRDDVTLTLTHRLTKWSAERELTV